VRPSGFLKSFTGSGRGRRRRTGTENECVD